MSSKTKQANRTKNNTRPSSSGRSAELLGSALPSFVGFTAIENCGFVPIVPGFTTTDNLVDEFDANIDSNHQIVLRKMTKKDPKTKVKALQEFIDIVNESDVDNIKDILPFWPKLYTNLSMDVEHRVRENTQQAQAAIVAKFGKSIAPFLRQLAPLWIISQYDTYAPAASIASTTFQKAFPPQKLKEVFNFCQNEILEFISKSLTFYTPQTLCNPKTYTPEESEEKYQRLIIASLKGYCLYLEKIDKTQLNDDAIAKNQQIIDNPKFWNFHKNKIPHIRAAWYEVIETILQHSKYLFEKHEAQLVATVFNNLDDTEPAVIPHVWASILLIQENYENYHTYVSLEKSFQPKLWKTLKSGGYGCATTIFPNLLPLISKLETILQDKSNKFYVDFFDNIKIALQSSSVQNSRSDVTAVASSYYECLQYIIIQKKDEQFCIELIDKHVLDIIGWSISSNITNKKYIFAQISKLINYWSQYDDNPIYIEFMKKVWSSMYEMMVKSIENVADIDRISEAHVDIILSLKQNMTRKKACKVKFNVEGDQVDAPSVDNLTAEPTYEKQLNSLVQNICDVYIKKIEINHKPILVERLDVLFKHFGNSSLYKNINADKSLTALTASIVGWLTHKKLRLEMVVEILLEILKFMENAERIDLITNLIKFNDENVKKWIITRILSHPLCNETYIPKLLALPEVTEYLVRAAINVTEDVNSNDNLNILHKCFFQTDSGEILIDKETSSKIVDIISIPLTSSDMLGVLDVCGSFLAQIMPVIFVDDNKKDLQMTMFLRLFHFSINQMVSDDLSEDTLWEITTSWQDALSSNDLKITDTVIEECAKIINEKLSSIKNLKSVDILENISDMIAKLILCSTEHITNETEKNGAIDKFLIIIFDEIKRQQTKNIEIIENLCEFVEAVSGKLTCSDIPDLNPDNVNYERTICDFIKYSILKLNSIFKMSCSLKANREKRDENDYDEELTEDYYDADENLVKVWTNAIDTLVVGVVYENALANILFRNQSTNIDDNETAIIYMQEKLSLLLKNVSDEKIVRLKTNIFDNSIGFGSCWASTVLPLLAIEKYNDKVKGPILLFEDYNAFAEIYTNNKINVLQSIFDKVEPKMLPILPEFLDNSMNILHKIVLNGCLITNHFSSNYNEMIDRKVVDSCLHLLSRVIGESRSNIDYLLYNKSLINETTDNIIFVTEIINFLTKTLKTFPQEFDIRQLDFVRIALSSWILSVSQSVDNFTQPKIAIFTAGVYRCFSAFAEFIMLEKTKSSTQMLTDVIDEWEQIFAKDVNMVLLKSYLKIVQHPDMNRNQMHKFQAFLDEISGAIDLIDIKYIERTERIDSKTTLDDLVSYCIKNISHKCHSVRIASANLLRRLTPNLISKDLRTWLTLNDEMENRNKDDDDIQKNWHLLNKFTETVDYQNNLISLFIKDFNFILSDENYESVDRQITLPYFLTWDCILNVCAESSSEMRSIYASWIVEHKYDQTLLVFLFRVMPTDVIRFPDSKLVYGQTMFAPLEWKQIKNPSISTERYACYLYLKMLRYLPAIARKWWHDLPSRQSSLIERITTNFVSTALCQDELRVVLDKRDKDDRNMNIKVHTTTREVVATYSIDETKLELVMTLPVNHPLGVVKVESGQQIGGRLQSRVVVMQLTIFLSHQNGSIWDGLSLWKRNLDRKFEGVEECYVCYSIIHQDTCQLPKLSCKTCKKKFHGPCLYKWFSTSNKSTCPICRNIF